MTEVSDVWNFFQKIPGEEKAKCKLCDNIYSCKKSSTKGLRDHLNAAHKQDYNEWKEKQGKIVEVKLC